MDRVGGRACLQAGVADVVGCTTALAGTFTGAPVPQASRKIVPCLSGFHPQRHQGRPGMCAGCVPLPGVPGSLTAKPALPWGMQMSSPFEPFTMVPPWSSQAWKAFGSLVTHPDCPFEFVHTVPPLALQAGTASGSLRLMVL